MGDCFCGGRWFLEGTRGFGGERQGERWRSDLDLCSGVRSLDFEGFESSAGVFDCFTSDDELHARPRLMSVSSHLTNDSLETYHI